VKHTAFLLLILCPLLAVVQSEYANPEICNLDPSAFGPITEINIRQTWDHGRDTGYTIVIWTHFQQRHEFNHVWLTENEECRSQFIWSLFPKTFEDVAASMEER